METFLGEPISYWIELQKRAEQLEVSKLIKEIAELYAKVGYYEARLDDIENFRKSFRS